MKSNHTSELMKKTGRIIFIVLGSLLLLNVILLLALNTSYVQTRIVEKVTKSLSEKTGSEISIGNIQLDIFDGLFLKDVYLEDLNSDTLAYVGNLNVNYSLKNIYKNNTLTLKSIGLDNFTIRLRQENDSSNYNFQFLVDAFSSDEPDTTSSSPFRMDVDRILLKNGSFSMDIASAEETPEQFNVKHLRVDSIEAALSLSLDLPSRIESSVENISGKEKSGLLLRHLETDVAFDLDSLIQLPEIEIETDKTTLRAENVSYRFANSEVNATIVESAIVPSDFRCFVPQLSSFKDEVEVLGNANLIFPELNVKSLSVKYPDFLSLDVPELYVRDLDAWEYSEMKCIVNQVKLSRKLPLIVKNVLSVELPSVVDSLLPCSASLKMEGVLPSLNQSLQLQCPVGTVQENGLVSYKADEEYLSASTRWNLDVLSLQPLLSSNMVGEIKGDMRGDVKWNLKRNPSVDVKADISTLVLNGYRYDTLKIKGSTKELEETELFVVSSDPNCNLDLQLTVNHLLSDDMQTELITRIDRLAPEKLQLTDSIGNLTVAGSFYVKGTGMDYNKWRGEISIDSLYLQKDSLQFFFPYVGVKQSVKGTEKIIDIQSSILNGYISGTFDYENIYPSFTNLMHRYLPTFFRETPDSLLTAELTFSLDISKTDSLLKYLNVNWHLADHLIAKGALSNSKNLLNVELSVPQMRNGSIKIAPSQVTLNSTRLGEKEVLAGTIATKIYPDESNNFSTAVDANLLICRDSIYNDLHFESMADTVLMKAKFRDCLSFHPLNSSEYEIRVDLDSSTIHLKDRLFRTNRSLIQMFPEKIIVSNLGFSTSDRRPIMMADGVLSSSLNDSMFVKFDKLRLKGILNLLYGDSIPPADCEINGTVKACAILGEDFRFSTRGFKIDDIVYDGNQVGNMKVSAVWDNARKGVFAKMDLEKDEQHLMNIKGVVLPAKQYVKMKAVLDNVPLNYIMPVAREYLSNFKGYVGSDINVEGELSDLKINGYVYLKDAMFKVNYTGVTYSISDSIKMDGNHFYAKNFKVWDDNNNVLIFNGDITHDKFTSFKYKMSLNMRDFAVLNNPKARKNMVYGTFYVNGKNLTLEGTETGVSLTGELSNADKTVVNITLPESVIEANTYDNIIYVKHEEEKKDSIVDSNPLRSNFDIYANLSVELTDKATFNVALSDGAMVRGNGKLRVLYEDNLLSLFNRFSVTDGYLKVKLTGLPTKKFTLQEGSYVDFTGDPMNLKFNATATYGLTADLSTLSSSFSTMGMSSTRVPVNCNLIASGSLTDMNLSYDVTVPKADEEIQKTVGSIISTDDIRIKEFAYLLGVGIFYDPTGGVQGNSALVSFASSSLTSALNGVLGNVSDKFTLGTDVNSSEDFSDVEVSVSASTKLANDKLLLSANVGYQTNTNGGDNPFMTDFDVEYLLGKTGMFRIKAYNHTNNDFYRVNKNMQGLGVSFVRESKQFNQLFRIKNEFNSIKKRNEYLTPDSIPAKKKSNHSMKNDTIRSERRSHDEE